MTELPLTQGKSALVDDEDFKELNQYKWHYNNGYAATVQWDFKLKKYTTIYMHRVITNCPDDKEVDHINHNKLDNQKHNLRIVNRSQNSMNKKKTSGCSSKSKGVSWNKKYNKWESYICINYNKIYLGYFDLEIDAISARNEKSKELFGEYSYSEVIL